MRSESHAPEGHIIPDSLLYPHFTRETLRETPSSPPDTFLRLKSARSESPGLYSATDCPNPSAPGQLSGRSPRVSGAQHPLPHPPRPVLVCGFLPWGPARRALRPDPQPQASEAGGARPGRRAKWKGLRPRSLGRVCTPGTSATQRALARTPGPCKLERTTRERTVWSGGRATGKRVFLVQHIFFKRERDVDNKNESEREHHREQKEKAQRTTAGGTPGALARGQRP